MADDIANTMMAKMRRLAFEVQQDGRLELIGEFIHPDYLDHTPPPGLSARYDGIEPRLKRLHGALKDIKVEIVRMLADEQTVAVQKLIRGIQVGDLPGKSATNKPVEMRTMEFADFKDGKFKDVWVTSRGWQDVEA